MISNLNPDLKWNANERFHFQKIGVVENGLGSEVSDTGEIWLLSV